ncbi:coproporphyrinogen III oxidase [Psychromonas hadalis]|uniref:coproporphyrinogen III oxidase n=1 Tax=Psychromonas hadalis TaxID=211669 RepID=UPI0003B6A64B|nr:coproporphyrinogen III oxidase [Psychromonas hadalis]
MRKPATSNKAINALKMLSQVQHSFVKQLSQLCQTQPLPEQFKSVLWLRDNGIHGGGVRFEAPQNSLFNQASVNVSQIQYEDQADKAFISATALSTIIHPLNALIPSIHIHVSWTELRSGKSYWRLMADLNPAIVCEQDKKRFNEILQQLGGDYFDNATTQGNEYFYIPALKKHRGVSHFYLEEFNPTHEDGKQFAKQFLTGVIECYIAIFSEHLKQKRINNEAQIQTQLDYHTLYFYQVLTLDKGTTSGLLVHDQNDVGTLGSLPAFINRPLLSQWIGQTPTPRDGLVEALLEVLPEDERCEISVQVKANIAQVIRDHYQHHPLLK